MLRGMPFGRRGHVYQRSRSRTSGRGAADCALCEALEPRQLLTQFVFNVPENEGFTSVYLQPGDEQGWVVVLKNSPTGTPVHEFRGDSNNGTGMYIVDAGGLDDFLFVDQVPAALKPTSSPGTSTDNGILVKASNATGGHLKIETGPDDFLIRVIESTASSATMRSYDLSENIGDSRFGDGVEQLTIQTNPTPTLLTVVEVGSSGWPALDPATTLRIESLGVGDAILLGGTENASVHAVVRTGAGNNVVLLDQASSANGTTTALVDFDPSLGGGLGSGNVLRIGSAGAGVNCTATLKRVPGTSSQHTITLDSVEVLNGSYTGIGEPARLVVEDPALIGAINIGGDPQETVGLPTASIEAPLTVANSSSTTGIATVDGIIEFFEGSAASSVYEFAIADAFDRSLGEVNVNEGAELTVLSPSEIAILNVLGGGNGASVLFKTTSRIRELRAFDGGLITLQARDQAPTSAIARALIVTNILNLGTPNNPSGKIDLKDNALIAEYSFADGIPNPFEDIRDLITSAYNGGGANVWLGNGITSSLGDDATYAVGYADNDGTSSGVDFESFAGQDVDDTTVLVKFTFYGDANLDGSVNLSDFDRLAANYGTQSGAVWAQGDFTYDGAVNLSDFNRLAANFGQSGLGDGEEEGGFESYTYEELWDMLMGGSGS